MTPGEEAGGLYEHYRVVADKGQQLLRVDKFLLVHLKDTSRNRIQAAAKAGFIHVNDQPVKSNYRVKPYDVVTLLLDVHVTKIRLRARIFHSTSYTKTRNCSLSTNPQAGGSPRLW